MIWASLSIFSSNDEILDMESNLLFGNFESDETSQEIQEHIRAMSRGKAVFQAKALGFVYHRLLAMKRRAIQDPTAAESQETTGPPDETGTTVLCARYLRIHTYVLSELRQGLYCPACHDYGKNGKGEYGRPFTRCGRCYELRDTVGKRCSGCDTLFKSK